MEYYHSFSETGLIQITDSNQELIFEKQLRKKVNQELYRKLWNLIQTTFDDFQIFMNSDKTEWGFGSNLYLPLEKEDGEKAIWFYPTTSSQIISIQVAFNDYNEEKLFNKNVIKITNYEFKNNAIIGSVNGIDILLKKLDGYGEWIYFKILNEEQLEFVLSYLKEIAPSINLKLVDKII